MVGIRYGNGFFILLEVAGFRGCTIIGGVRNRQCVGDVYSYVVDNVCFCFDWNNKDEYG